MYYPSGIIIFTKKAVAFPGKALISEESGYIAISSPKASKE